MAGMAVARSGEHPRRIRKYVEDGSREDGGQTGHIRGPADPWGAGPAPAPHGSAFENRFIIRERTDNANARLDADQASRAEKCGGDRLSGSAGAALPDNLADSDAAAAHLCGRAPVV